MEIILHKANHINCVGCRRRYFKDMRSLYLWYYDIRLLYIDQPSDVSTICRLMCNTVWRTAIDINSKLSNQLYWGYVIYSNRDCIAFTQNRAGSCGFHPLYTSTSIIMNVGIKGGKFKKPIKVLLLIKVSFPDVHLWKPLTHIVFIICIILIPSTKSILQYLSFMCIIKFVC